LLAIAALTALPAPASADTAVATRWKPLSETQNACMGHARMALFRAGFDADPSSQSMSSKHGEFTASIRCVAEQQIVFFVIAGPSPEMTLGYLDSLYTHF
jgi:hypothetical protein